MPRTHILDNVAEPACLSCHVINCQTVIVPDGGPAIDPFLGYLIDGTLVTGPNDVNVLGVPLYGADESDLSGAIPLDLQCVALVTEGVVIIQVEPTEIVNAGDRVAFLATGAIRLAAGGEFSFGQALDNSDGTGTVADPHYVRVHIDRVQL